MLTPTFTSSASGGATGNTASGAGNLNETLTLPAGGSVTYLVTGTIDQAATGTSDNTVTVTAPPTAPDLTGSIHSATDSDTLAPAADLGVVKTVSGGTTLAGDNITYTVTLTNHGPSNSQTVSLSDAVPANTTFVSATQTSGPAFALSPPPPGGGGNNTSLLIEFIQAERAKAEFYPTAPNSGDLMVAVYTLKALQPIAQGRRCGAPWDGPKSGDVTPKALHNGGACATPSACVLDWAR